LLGKETQCQLGMKVIQNLFSSEELASLQNLAEVEAAYAKLSTQTNVYFSIPASELVKQRLEDSFGLNLDSVSSIPCRWIKGYTVAHTDRG